MVWIAAVVAAVFGLITLFGVMPFLRKRIIAAEADADNRCAAVLGSGFGFRFRRRRPNSSARQAQLLFCNAQGQQGIMIMQNLRWP